MKSNQGKTEQTAEEKLAEDRELEAMRLLTIEELEELKGLLGDRAALDAEIRKYAETARKRAAEVTRALPQEDQELLRAWVAAKRAVKGGESVLKVLTPMVLALVQRHPGGVLAVDGAEARLDDGVSYEYSKAIMEVAAKLKLAKELAQADGSAVKVLTKQVEFKDMRQRQKGESAAIKDTPPVTRPALTELFRKLIGI